MTTTGQIQPIASQWGGAVLPLSAGSISATELDFADVAQSSLLALFASAINAEFTAPWVKVCASLPSGTPLCGSPLPVADTLAADATTHTMKVRKPAFPLLCLSRQGERQYEQVTIEEWKATQQWDLDWFLGPHQSIGEDAKLVAAMTTHVPGLVAQVIRDRGHVSYQSGTVQWRHDLTSPSTLGSVKMLKSAAGQAKFAGDEKQALYWVCTMRLETVEYLADLPAAYPSFEGMDVSASVGNATELLADLILADTDYPGI